MGGGNPRCQEVVEDHSGQQHSSHSGQSYHTPGILKGMEQHFRVVAEDQETMFKFSEKCVVFVSVMKSFLSKHV